MIIWTAKAAESERKEPEDFIDTYRFELRKGDSRRGILEAVLIGYVAHLDKGFDEQGYDSWELLEAHSQDLQEYADALFTKDGEWLERSEEEIGPCPPGNIFIVHLCVVRPESRGRGLGLSLVQFAVQRIGALCHLTACLPHNVQHLDVARYDIPQDWLRAPAPSTDQLLSYWERAGLSRLTGTQILVG